MKVVERLIWQERDVAHPWVLLVRACERRKKVNVTSELYADWITYPHRVMICEDDSRISVDELVRMIEDEVAIRGHSLISKDVECLKKELKFLSIMLGDSHGKQSDSEE